MEVLHEFFFFSREEDKKRVALRPFEPITSCPFRVREQANGHETAILEISFSCYLRCSSVRP